MNKTAVKNFAVWARNKLIKEITYKAGLLGVNENGIAPELPASTDTLKLYDIGTKEPAKVEGIAITQRNSLVNAVNNKAQTLKYRDAFEYVIEEAAYTWFNRLIAVRFMEVNGYLPSGVRVLSSEKANKNEPDMVTSPFETDIEFTEKDRKYMDTLKDDELFRFLFIKQCNALHDILPELFEKTADYSEILLTLSFTDTDSVVYHLVHDIPEEDFNIDKEGQVQIIGWLYQYYNTEPKDKVFAALKKNVKISKENIPAATQLFTPDWIVRYMVENSLGRLWVDGHEDFDKSEWKYYLEEAEQEESVKAKLSEIRAEYKSISPEEIRFCDPCMGSGHILVYAFDVLMQIYLSQGYSERDAAAKIIRNNLYGLDIDKRAYQLAYFAVKMKAVQYDSRFLKRKETKHLEPNLSHFQGLDGVQNATVTGALKDFAAQFKNCETYGSLLEISAVNGLDEARDNFSGVLDMNFEQTEQMMRIYTVLSQKYDVVCTNPPYMGGGGMCETLSDFLKKNYPDSKSDLSTCFMQKCENLCKEHGYYSMINIPVWMFLSSYEKLREIILLKNTYINMVHFGRGIFGSDFGTTVFIIKKERINDYIGVYRRLFEKQGAVDSVEQKEKWFFEGMGYHTAKQENYSKIPGVPVAYWVSDNFIKAFENNLLQDLSNIKKGLSTGDNDCFLRLWYEVEITKCGFNLSRYCLPYKWIPINKGGGYKKWYGNNEYLINWFNDGAEIKQYSGSVIRNSQFYFLKSITWTMLSASCFGVRYSQPGKIFEGAGPSLFVTDENIKYVLALLCSSVGNKYVRSLNPTLNINIGDVGNVPVIIDKNKKTRIDDLANENISVCKTDWDSFETSWDFKKHPLLNGEKTISEAFDKWTAECENRFNTLKSNEEELNRIFIDIYGLQDELTPEVEDKDVTVRKADLQREIKSLISYAVGCMFGRYSIDLEGLVYAGGDFDTKYCRWIAQFGEEADKYIDEQGNLTQGGWAGCTMWKYDGVRKNNKWCKATFAPDKDNCIPITDEEYFTDDIVTRFAEFVKAVYGENTLEENLDFIADALGTKGNTSRQKIRTYFLNDFIKDHIKIYQKRPIYWLFDSGKQNGFKALVYMHRWNVNTIGIVRVDYLYILQGAYESEINRMQDTIDNTSDNREKALAEKRRDKLSKQLKEARDYDEKLTHLALSRINIDLDDGVKVNYEKVQTAQDGRKLEILTPIK